MNITLLDGSVGQELVKRTDDRATPLWSTQVMIDHPHLVGEIHRDYIAAGATVLSANTYAVHRSRLERVGLEDRMLDLLGAALDQVENAKATTPGTRIAGTLGPLLASYRPDLDANEDLAEERFAEIATAMGNRVDLLLLETVSSLQEARGALRGTVHSTAPVWIAFSVDDHDGTRLRSGEPVADVASVLTDQVEAVLINCSRPEVIADALPDLAATGLPYGAYANGFTQISDGFKADFPTVDSLEQRKDLGPQEYADIAMGWVDQGATIVGGCCEIGPAHIAEIATRLRAAGHQIV